MKAEAKQRIQLALAFAILVAAGRAGYILYQRHEDAVAVERQKQARKVGYSNPDYYVTPKKLYPYDLKSAKQITQQPVWAKEGYRYTYYTYRAGKVDFDHEAGLLLPIERLEIKDVVTATPHGTGNRKQVMAIFQKNGESYAVPIGFESDDCDRDFRAVMERGAVAVEPPNDKPWGARSAYLQGPGRLTFEIEQPLK